MRVGASVAATAATMAAVASAHAAAATIATSAGDAPKTSRAPLRPPRHRFGSVVPPPPPSCHASSLYQVPCAINLMYDNSGEACADDETAKDEVGTGYMLFYRYKCD